MKADRNRITEPSIDVLRGRAAHLEALEKRIAELEAEQELLLGSTRDMTGALRELHGLMGEWEWFFEHSLDMMCITGMDGQFKRVNPAFARALGYDNDELLTRPFLDFVHPDDREQTLDVFIGLGSEEDCVNFENRYLDSEGNWHWIAWHCPALTPSARNLYAIARDVTDQKRADSELLYRARHDSLTGLLNRAAFEEGLGEAIGRASRDPGHELALYMVDLDGFKNVNDTHGHPAGDHLLKQVGARLRQTAREGEMVCRLGGDEFALLIEGHAGLPVEPLARRIDDAICQPAWAQEPEGIGCCIGISVLPRHAQDAGTLISQADLALYSVKRAGGGGFRTYVPEVAQ